MRPPRGLSAEEAALWKRVTETVTPLHPVKEKRTARTPLPPAGGGEDKQAALRTGGPAATPRTKPKPATTGKSTPAPSPKREERIERHGLDASWERKLARGAIAPDVTIDLHGHGLDAAHARLVSGLTQALAMGARVVLLITGRPRPHGDHGVHHNEGRGERRGAIRAKLVDWLAASPHASSIAAVRNAQPRHGGAGAVYIVLRRKR